MSKKNKLASIIILSYNSRDDLAECIPSLMVQTYHNFEIIVVDNASADGSAEFIKNNYPNIKLIKTGENLGYPAGNNIGFKHARGEYIVVVNPDTLAEPDWLAELIRPFEDEQDIALTTSKILMYHQRDIINTCANTTHYTGLDFCRGLDQPSESYSMQQTVGAISGCSFAIRRTVLEQLDGFDPDFFLYLEDTDLSWRTRLAGGRIFYVPTSVIYHKYNISIAAWKHFYLERNRYLMLIKNMNIKTLILLFPGLLISEVITMGHATLNGPEYVKSKFRAYMWIARNINVILGKRQKIFATKQISDKEFYSQLDWRIPFEQVIEYKWMRWSVDVLFNSFYRAHFWFVCRLV